MPRTIYAVSQARYDAQRRTWIREGRALSMELRPVLDRRTVGRLMQCTPQAVEQIECLALYKVAKRLKELLQCAEFQKGYNHGHLGQRTTETV